MELQGGSCSCVTGATEVAAAASPPTGCRRPRCCSAWRTGPLGRRSLAACPAGQRQQAQRVRADPQLNTRSGATGQAGCTRGCGDRMRWAGPNQLHLGLRVDPDQVQVLPHLQRASAGAAGQESIDAPSTYLARGWVALAHHLHKAIEVPLVVGAHRAVVLQRGQARGQAHQCWEMSSHLRHPSGNIASWTQPCCSQKEWPASQPAGRLAGRLAAQRAQWLAGKQLTGRQLNPPQPAGRQLSSLTGSRSKTLSSSSVIWSICRTQDERAQPTVVLAAACQEAPIWLCAWKMPRGRIDAPARTRPGHQASAAGRSPGRGAPPTSSERAWVHLPRCSPPPDKGTPPPLLHQPC